MPNQINKDNQPVCPFCKNKMGKLERQESGGLHIFLDEEFAPTVNKGLLFWACSQCGFFVYESNYTLKDYKPASTQLTIPDGVEVKTCLIKSH